MNDMAKNLILWLIIAAVLVTVMNNFSSPPESHKLNYSEFIQQVQEGKVKEVTVDGYLISAKSIDGNTFDIVRPAIADNGLIKDLMDNMNMQAWFSAICHRGDQRVSPAGVPAPCHELDDLFDMIILLKPEKDATIQLDIIRNYGEVVEGGKGLRLDPTTMMVKEL